MKRPYIRIIIIAMLLSMVGVFQDTTPTLAHRSGCHRWHSCPSDTGSYTCGDTGHSNYCGGSTYNVHIPVVTTQNLVTYEDIPSRVVKRNNQNEYVGYEKLITAGSQGKRKIVTLITYTDGVESSRGDPVRSIDVAQTDTVYEVGIREKPSAYIDFIAESDHPGFWNFLGKQYDISASAQPHGDFALMKNGKVIMLGKSGRTGMLDFKNVSVKTGDELSIGTYSGSKILWMMPKADQVSERSTVDTKNMTITTKYDALHKQKNKRTDKGVRYAECPQALKDTYFKTLSNVEKKVLSSVESETIYYTEIPCTMSNPNYRKS